MIYRLILPTWAKEESPHLPKILEGEFNDAAIEEHNQQGYNIYYLPNFPSEYVSGTPIVGSQITNFKYVFVDLDLKDGAYPSKEAFILKLAELVPTRIIDSGNGLHAYWAVEHLDAMSYLKLTRRLIRHFNTDEAVGSIFQLMRAPNTVNMKEPNDLKVCQIISEVDKTYTCEELDKFLAPLTSRDEEHCLQHYNKTYNITNTVVINDTIPLKFMHLLRMNSEVKAIWGDPSEDRSRSDYRLGHILYAQGFTKAEASSVLVNSAKALGRGPTHRISYATNIIDKIWLHEVPVSDTPAENPEDLELSASVLDILNKHGSELKGIRFPCYNYIDNTANGFRLGQVIGLVAGSGVGKTAVALNMFKGFVENNPDYDHFFVSLEQPAREIAERWMHMCGKNTRLYSKVHVIDNHDAKGNYRNLSLDQIKTYLLKFQAKTERKIGCVVIDHIGVLNKRTKLGLTQDLMDICASMKSFARETNTMLIMQSQTSREKAGIGDLELNKDAAFGTSVFESFCDYLITLWQPLKRVHKELDCPLVTAIKFCKIRHKQQHLDIIKEDIPYMLIFDPATESLREITQQEEQSFKFFLQKATNKRKADRQTDIIEYTSTRII